MQLVSKIITIFVFFSMKYFLLLQLFISSFYGYAQLSKSNQYKVDSLYLITLNKSNNIKKRCIAYNRICWLTAYQDYNQGLKYSSEYFRLAKTNNLHNRIAISSHFKGHSQMMLGDFDDANKSLLEGLEVSLKNDNFKQIAKLYTDLGNLRLKTGNTNQAIKFYTKSLEIAEKHNFIVQKARAKINISQIHEAQGNYKLSLKVLQEVLSICEKNKLVGFLSSVYGSLGDVNLNIKEYESAEKNYKLALGFAEKLENSNKKIESLAKLGRLKQEQDSLNSATQYFKKSLKIASKKELPALKAEVLSSLSSNKLKQKKYHEALKYVIESINLFEEYSIQENLGEAYLIAAQVYKELGRKNLSKTYFQKCYDIAFLNNNFNMLNTVTQSLAVVFEEKGNKRMALKYYKEFIKYNAQKRDDDDVKEIIKIELNANYRNKAVLDSLSKINEISLLRFEHSRNETSSLYRTYFAYAGIGILSIILVFVVYFFEQKRKSAVILSKKNRVIAQVLKDKEILLKEVHHRVKNNMQVVSSLLKLKSINTNEKLAKIALVDSQKQIDSMLLIHQKMYQNEDYERVCIVDYCQDIVALLLNPIETQKDVFVVNGEALFIHIEQAQTLGFIIHELIANSLKHAWDKNQPKRIELTFKKINNEFQFEYSDNGKGMPSDFNLEKAKSFGTKLIYSLVKRQLLGSIELSYKEGIHIRIKFDAR